MPAIAHLRFSLTPCGSVRPGTLCPGRSLDLTGVGTTVSEVVSLGSLVSVVFRVPVMVVVHGRAVAHPD